MTIYEIREKYLEEKGKEPIEKIMRYTKLSKEEILKI